MRCKGINKYGLMNYDKGKRCRNKTNDKSGYCKYHRGNFIHYTTTTQNKKFRKLIKLLREDLKQFERKLFENKIYDYIELKKLRFKIIADYNKFLLKYIMVKGEIR